MANPTKGLCFKIRGGCLGDKTKEIKKQSMFPVLYKTEWMERIAVEWRGKGREARVAAPLLLWAIH